MLVQFESINLEVREESTHEWLLETALVAEGYGVNENSLRSTKSRNDDELIEGKHWLVLQSATGRSQVFYTKRGVIRLGFFIKSERAKKFRDFAEDLILKNPQSSIPVPTNFLEALKLLVEKEESNLRLELKVDNLSTALDSLVEWISILKVSNFNKVHEKSFDWRLIKRRSEEMGFVIKKAQSPRYGFQNLYHVNAFKSCYPQYNYKFLNDSQLIKI